MKDPLMRCCHLSLHCWVLLWILVISQLLHLITRVHRTRTHVCRICLHCSYLEASSPTHSIHIHFAPNIVGWSWVHACRNNAGEILANSLFVVSVIWFECAQNLLHWFCFPPILAHRLYRKTTILVLFSYWFLGISLICELSLLCKFTHFVWKIDSILGRWLVVAKAFSLPIVIYLVTLVDTIIWGWGTWARKREDKEREVS